MCIRDRYKTLAHSRLSPFTSTKDLIAPAIFLPFTTFLLHSASFVPFSSNIYPKYLNSDTCSSCSPSNITSHDAVLIHNHNLTLIYVYFQTPPFTQPAKSLYQSSQTLFRFATQNQIIRI